MRSGLSPSANFVIWLLFFIWMALATAWNINKGKYDHAGNLQKEEEMVYRRKPGGVFHYDFQYDGQRFRGSTKQTNEKQAKMYESQKLVEAMNGKLGIRKVPLLKDYTTKFENFIKTEARNKRGEPLDADTKRYYKNGIRILLDSRYAKMHLDKIREYIPAEGVNPPTANCAVRTLRRILGRAKAEQIIRDVPKLPDFGDRERDKIYPTDMFDKILTLSRQPMRDILLTIHETAMRPEEVFRSRIDWIDWNNRTIFIPDGKTENSRRLLPITDRLLDALVVRCADKEVRKTGWIFPARNKQSRSGHTTTIAKEWARVRKLVGLSAEYVPYCARHTAGTRVYDATGNLKLVMQFMGHNDTKTAMRYQHPAIEQLRDVLNKKPTVAAITETETKRIM